MGRIKEALKKEQDKLQKKYCLFFDSKKMGGIWIVIKCRKCEKDISSPYWLSGDKCPNCRYTFRMKR